MEFSVGYCSVERGEWSAENGNLAKCLRKFKVYFKFLWIFCFMKHGKWIVKTEFAWIFRLFCKRLKMTKFLLCLYKFVILSFR